MQSLRTEVVTLISLRMKLSLRQYLRDQNDYFAKTNSKPCYTILSCIYEIVVLKNKMMQFTYTWTVPKTFLSFYYFIYRCILTRHMICCGTYNLLRDAHANNNEVAIFVRFNWILSNIKSNKL
jgi:hypothetical protein